MFGVALSLRLQPQSQVVRHCLWERGPRHSRYPDVVLGILFHSVCELPVAVNRVVRSHGYLEHMGAPLHDTEAMLVVSACDVRNNHV